MVNACVPGHVYMGFQEQGWSRGLQSELNEGLMLWCVLPGCSRKELKTLWLTTGLGLGARQKWDGYHGIYRKPLLGPKLGCYCEL